MYHSICPQKALCRPVRERLFLNQLARLSLLLGIGGIKVAQNKGGAPDGCWSRNLIETAAISIKLGKASI